MLFFNDTATTEIYTLSLHDALPISCGKTANLRRPRSSRNRRLSPHSRSTSECTRSPLRTLKLSRSEEHTSELQSRQYLVCRLLLEKKNYHITLYHLYDVPSTFHPIL